MKKRPALPAETVRATTGAIELIATPTPVVISHAAMTEKDPEISNNAISPDNYIGRPLQAGAQLAILLGGYIPLAYVLGYCYRWSYLSAFGAGPLIGQANAAHILLGTIWNIVPLMVFLFGRILPISPADTRVEKSGLFQMVVAVCVSLAAYLIGRHLAPLVRAMVYDTCTLFLAIALFYFARVIAAESLEPREMIRSLISFVVIAFVILPIVRGQRDGCTQLSTRLAGEPVVHFNHNAKRLRLLLAGGDRVFCVADFDERHLTITPVPWSEVESIVSSP